MQEIPITTEQEAAVTILFTCVLSEERTLSESQVEHLSRMLVLSSKFKGSSLNELTVQALTLQSKFAANDLIEFCGPLVSEDFRETLFAMCCELLTANGSVNEKESKVLAMIALYLGLSIETMRMMLTTYLIRNRWNVQVVEPEES
jgi:uncharacterized tellurite resistance protein B-like protein